MAETSGFATDLQQSSYLAHTMRRAISAATQRSHRYVTLEHLLLALLDDPDAIALLEGLRVDIAAVKTTITEVVNRNLDAKLYTPGEFDLRASYKVERTLQTASDDARRLSCSELDAAFVLAALAREIDSPAAELVKKNGLGFTNAVTWLYSNRGNKFKFGTPTPARSAPVPSEPVAEPRETAPQRDEAPPQREVPALQDDPAKFGPEDDEEALELVLLDDDEYEPEPSAQVSQTEMLRALQGSPPQSQPPAKPVPPKTPPAALEEAPAQVERRGPAGPPQLPRRLERELFDATRAAETASELPPGGRDAPRQAREPDERVAPPSPRPNQDEQPALAAPPRRIEPKLPPAARLDEMRLRTTASGPQPASTPPMPHPAPKGGRKKRHVPVSNPVPVPKRSGQRRQRPNEVFAGKLVENIPRRMRDAVTERVEIRISREETDALTKGLEGRGEPIHHDLIVTSAMSVMLRAPDGGFSIEPLSPETQWIFDGPESPDAEPYGRWRWAVTPTGAGQRRLQVIIAARSVDASGMVGDTALPEQVISVRVRTNYVRGMKRLFEWLIVMAVGGAVTELAATALRIFK